LYRADRAARARSGPADHARVRADRWSPHAPGPKLTTRQELLTDHQRSACDHCLTVPRGLRSSPDGWPQAEPGRPVAEHAGRSNDTRGEVVRTTRFRSVSVIGVLLALTLLAAACGSDRGADPDEGTDTGERAEAPEGGDDGAGPTTFGDL